MDFGNGKTSRDSYWNCGDSCSLFSVEKSGGGQGQAGSQQQAIVGRNYHSGIVTYNEPDLLHIQQFTRARYMGMESSKDLIGLGKCVQGSPYPDCKGHPGANILVAWRLATSDTTSKPYAIALVNDGRPLNDRDQATAVRLGVLLDETMTWVNGTSVAVCWARVMVGDTIQSFELANFDAKHASPAGAAPVTVRSLKTSPPLPPNVAKSVRMWAPGHL
jgi:hypothetical protein